MKNKQVRFIIKRCKYMYAVTCTFIFNMRKISSLTWGYLVCILFARIRRSISSRALARVIHEGFSFHSQCLSILSLQQSGLLWLALLSSSFGISNCNPSVFQFSTVSRHIRRFFMFNVGSAVDNNNKLYWFCGHVQQLMLIHVINWGCQHASTHHSAHNVYGSSLIHMVTWSFIVLLLYGAMIYLTVTILLCVLISANLAMIDMITKISTYWPCVMCIHVHATSIMQFLKNAKLVLAKPKVFKNC